MLQHLSIAAVGVSATGRAIDSGRGTMTSSTDVSEKSKTLSIVCCSSASSTPARSPWRSSMRSSTSLWEASSRCSTSDAEHPHHEIGQPVEERDEPAEDEEEHRDQRRHREGDLLLARGSVYDFGTISPITTCRIEMKNSASATETTAEAQNDVPK